MINALFPAFLLHVSLPCTFDKGYVTRPGLKFDLVPEKSVDLPPRRAQGRGAGRGRGGGNNAAPSPRHRVVDDSVVAPPAPVDFYLDKRTDGPDKQRSQ